LQRLVDRGASITVTPEVELQMGFGDPLTGRLRALGARPSIGADVESSLGGDMFTTMRTALQSQRALDNLQVIKATGKAPERLSISCREALAWATRNGAAMVGLEHRIGSLAPGKQADVVLLRADDLNLFPVVDPVRSIVLHAGAGNVDTVLIAGRVVKRAGKLSYRHLPERMAQLAEASHRITSAIGAVH
jgi:5-methylthioadenosine/S-adenosylhomocysteine deaminase